ncbi:serine hydrolase domain-containing protein [Kitasatospora paranensis]|uniref:serine hydrolase domain-containing protein n=1 Tax=Kitasatospora paranensis TaxID=258053 RepID=UPI0031EBD07E
MTRTRRALLCAATLITATLQTTATAAAADTRPAAAVRGHGEHACTSTPQPLRGQARRVLETVRQAQRDLDLKSVEFKVTVDGKELITDALGESMTDVPAEPDMQFRAGSVGIAYMGTVLLQLVQEGRVGLDDKISRWLPDAPHADEITLRMLGSSTSGLHDYVTDPVFLAELEAHPFKQWTPEEVVGISASHPLWYRPGTNWSYSHANFQLLGAALEKITGTRLDRLLQERVMDPLGLRHTSNSFTPEIPDPVLHAFTSERASTRSRPSGTPPGRPPPAPSSPWTSATWPGPRRRSATVNCCRGAASRCSSTPARSGSAPPPPPARPTSACTTPRPSTSGWASSSRTAGWCRTRRSPATRPSRRTCRSRSWRSPSPAPRTRAPRRSATPPRPSPSGSPRCSRRTTR